MQLRPGAEFDETILDRDIRSLYRTGRFKSTEIKHERLGPHILKLVVVVTPKAG